MPVEVFDDCSVDDLPKRKALIERITLHTIDGGQKQMDGFSDLNGPRALALDDSRR